MAASTAKVGQHFQVVIPKELRKAANLSVGDLLRAELRYDGILLKRATVRRPKFTPEIERHLREAEKDRKAGRMYGPFDSTEKLLDSLHKGVSRPA